MPRRSRLSDDRKQFFRAPTTPIEPNTLNTVYILTVRLIPFILIALAALTIVGCAVFTQRDSAPPVTHLHQLTPNLYSGAEPVGDRAFAHLAAHGIATVISVDGAWPDVEAAAEHNIRTVHIPVGYHGINAEQSTQIIAAVRASPGPVFIHCHHGQHRGPTAAALCAIALNDWSHHRATNWMRYTGQTGTQYAGLYETATRFKPPTEDALAAIDTDALPSRAEPGRMTETMVFIDEQFDNIKAFRKAGWRTPADRPGFDIDAEAMLLWDHFDQLERLHNAGDDDLRTRLSESKSLVAQIGKLLDLRIHDGDYAGDAKPKLEAAFTALRRNCVSCHRAHRN